MTELYLRRAANSTCSLLPSDVIAEKYINQLNPNQIVKIKISVPRNYENHKRFFSFLNTTFEMQSHFETPEHYRRWLVMKAGYYSTCVAPNGNTMFFADSISFDKMDETTFRELFSECINIFLKNLGKDMTKDDLMKVIAYD